MLGSKEITTAEDMIVWFWPKSSRICWSVEIFLHGQHVLELMGMTWLTSRLLIKIRGYSGWDVVIKTIHMAGEGYKGSNE
jgi:hypothetical protein